MIDFKNLFQSKNFTKMLLVLGAALLIVVIFEAGMFVGYQKAAFSYKMGDNYYKTFGSPRRGALPDFPRGEFGTAHGAAGKIIKIDLPKITVLGEDGIEKIVVLNDKTSVMRFREVFPQKNLVVDDFVVVIGSPNDAGYVEAKLVRLIPSPEDFNIAGTVKK